MTSRAQAHRFLARAALAGLAVALSAAPVSAFEIGSGQSFSIGEGETRGGDLYAFAETVDVLGTQDGDLVACARNVNVAGTVTGDLLAAGESINITGRVGDAVRAAGNTLTVTGTIEGDLIAFGQRVVLTGSSRVTGDLVSFGQYTTIGGEVEGNVKAGGQSVVLNGSVGGSLEGTAGEVVLAGRVGRNVELNCDTLRIEPGARVEGDLTCAAREAPDLEGLDVVGGEVNLTKKKADVERRKEHGISGAKIAFRVALVVASLLVGFVCVGVFGKLAPSVERAVGRETLPSLGVGFVIAIVLPVAAFIVALLVVTIPLVAIVLLLWGIALYVAKLPVALWLGRTILRALGSKDPSPHVGLLIGLVLLYAAFYLPYLGWLAYFASALLGLGALVLGTRSHLRGSRTSPAPSG